MDTTILVIAGIALLGVILFFWANARRDRFYREISERQARRRAEVTSGEPDFAKRHRQMLDAIIREAKNTNGDRVKAAENLGWPHRTAVKLAEEIERLCEPDTDRAKMPPNMGGIGNPPYQGPDYFIPDQAAISRDYRSDEQRTSGQFGHRQSDFD